MKKLTFLAIALLLAVMSGCERKDGIYEPSEAEAKQARETGSQYAAQLMVNLKGTLQSAIQEKGLVNAIEVCNVEAMALTKAVESEGVEIKRTTNKVRNPQNAPDAVEQTAWAYFAGQQQETGNLPGDYVQKVRLNGQDYLYYYKPLQIAQLCLPCHGDPQLMPAELQQAINERYPTDQAIGYAEGDLRGMIRVKMPLKG